MLLIVGTLAISVLRLIMLHAAFVESSGSAETLLSIGRILAHIGRVVGAVVVWVTAISVATMLILTVGLLIVLSRYRMTCGLLRTRGRVGGVVATLLSVVTIPRGSLFGASVRDDGVKNSKGFVGRRELRKRSSLQKGHSYLLWLARGIVGFGSRSKSAPTALLCCASVLLSASILLAI